MISRLLHAFERGVRYAQRHPQILLAFILVVLLPLAFLYSADKFLEAGRANQDRLQLDRLGLLHDSFVSILSATDYDIERVQTEIERITTLNPDLTSFMVIRQSGQEFTILAALDKSQIGEPLENSTLLRNAAAQADVDSLVFPAQTEQGRVWQAVRATQTEVGDFYYIVTVNDLSQVDALLESREHTAYIYLAIIYVLIMLVAWWVVRLTDYRYLYQESQQAIKTKDLFTNMIAHELRAPLTAMRGYASMIEESTEATQESKKYATRIRESSERLLAIVNDLLDVARIQSGKLKVETTQSDLSSIVLAVTEELLPSAKEKGIRVEHSGTDRKHVAHIDSKRMHQAITNLVSNAIKYTKAGTIELALKEKGDAIELRVKDTGTGISATDQKKLFAPFFRVASDDVSQISGSGLGMWITRQLIELMGATIGVESIKGVGTHVVVTVPKRQR